jgi:hypothetical protein
MDTLYNAEHLLNSATSRQPEPVCRHCGDPASYSFYPLAAKRLPPWASLCEPCGQLDEAQAEMANARRILRAYAIDTAVIAEFDATFAALVADRVATAALRFALWLSTSAADILGDTDPERGVTDDNDG